MAAPIATRDGQTISAWLLKANPKRYDAVGALDAFGVIDGFSVHETYRLDLMQAGQRCFLYVGGDEAGIWGVGEVIGPVYTAHVEDDGFYVDEEVLDEVRRFVPVEIRRLASPIPRADLLSLPELADCELFRSPQQGNPNVLRPDEVAALESFDLSVVPPTARQLTALASSNAEADAGTVAIVYDLDDAVYVVEDIGDDDQAEYRVRMTAGERETELGRFRDFGQALESLAAVIDEIGGRAPIQDVAPDADVTSLAIILLNDGGRIHIVRVGTGEFTAFDQLADEDSGEPFASYPSASSALVNALTAD